MINLITTCIAAVLLLILVALILVFIFNHIVKWIFSFSKCKCKDPQMNYRFNAQGKLVCKECGGHI